MENINDKGSFSTVSLLRLTHPVGQDWWFALVGIYTYVWDVLSFQWLNRAWVASNSDLLNWNPWTYYLDEMNHTRDFNSIAASWPIDSTFRITKVDCTTWDITITLPTAVWFTGILDIMKIDSSVNIVIVDPSWAETISWETTQVIYGQYDNMTIVSDNSNWFII